jgi:hypothetical protein
VPTACSTAVMAAMCCRCIAAVHALTVFVDVIALPHWDALGPSFLLAPQRKPAAARDARLLLLPTADTDLLQLTVLLAPEHDCCFCDWCCCLLHVSASACVVASLAASCSTCGPTLPDAASCCCSFMACLTQNPSCSALSFSIRCKARTTLSSRDNACLGCHSAEHGMPATALTDAAVAAPESRPSPTGCGTCCKPWLVSVCCFHIPARYTHAFPRCRYGTDTRKSLEVRVALLNEAYLVIGNALSCRNVVSCVIGYNHC